MTSVINNKRLAYGELRLISKHIHSQLASWKCKPTNFQCLRLCARWPKKIASKPL